MVFHQQMMLVKLLSIQVLRMETMPVMNKLTLQVMSFPEIRWICYYYCCCYPVMAEEVE